MSFLSRAQAQVFTGAHKRAERFGPASDFWYSPLGMSNTAGERVSAQTALTLSAMWQGTRLLGEGIGGMPCQLFRQIDERRRERLRDDFAYRMRWQPNQWQTAMQFYNHATTTAVMRGAFFAEIKQGQSGPRDYFEPIHTARVAQKRLPSGRVMFYIGTERRPVTQDHMLAIRLRTEEDGITPQSLIEYGSQQLGVSIAADKYRGKFFSQGAQASLAVIDKDELGEEGLKNLHTSVSLYLNGQRNSFGVLPLEGDIKIEKLGFTPAEAQMAETLNIGLEDVARWLNIPLHMLRVRSSGASAYASLEVFSAEFVTYTLRPIAIAIEQSLQRDVLLPEEKLTHFFEFNMDALLRGDLKSRYEAYRSGIMSGFLKRNEARMKENLDADDPELDKYILAMNLGQVDGASGSKEGAARVLEFRKQTAIGREGYRMVVLAQESAGRLVRQERAAVEKLAKTHANDADGWQAGLRDFYKDFAGRVSENLCISHDRALAYAEAQGEALSRRGVAAMADWDWCAVETLALEALETRAA